jgi:hypothetical protein
MSNRFSQRTYDNALLLKAAGLVAASANGSVILDVGNGLVDADLIMDVTAIEIDTTDESYAIVLEGSPDSDFGTAANIVVLNRRIVGHASAAAMAPAGVTSTVGRYLDPVRNEINGTTYRYLRLRTVVAGTIATGINYLSFLAIDSD